MFDVKKLFDFIVASLLLFLFSPLFVLLYFISFFLIGPPVIFSQIRPGFQGKLFVMYKFRTMRNEFTEDGIALPDEERLIRFGTFLRSTSLDELPELFNVLRGEMSLVGPRPLLMEYLPLYNPEQARRHEVRPGITGWAQINGRNSISWEEKFALDVWYVDNHSLWLDVKILLLTIKKVFFRQGISQEGHVTAEKFNGGTKDG